MVSKIQPKNHGNVNLHVRSHSLDGCNSISNKENPTQSYQMCHDKSGQIVNDKKVLKHDQSITNIDTNSLDYQNLPFNRRANVRNQFDIPGIDNCKQSKFKLDHQNSAPLNQALQHNFITESIRNLQSVPQMASVAMNNQNDFNYSSISAQQKNSNNILKSKVIINKLNFYTEYFPILPALTVQCGNFYLSRCERCF